MNIESAPTPDCVSVDTAQALISLDRNEHLLSELAVTFREDGERFLNEYKTFVSEGRFEPAVASLLKIELLAIALFAEPVTTLCRQGRQLLESQSSNESLTHLIPKIETALQGTVDLLRSEGLLQETTRFPEPIDRPTEEVS